MIRGSDGPRGVGATEPEDFGQYRLVEPLGRGGMGEVFRAVDTHRERTVALKRLHVDLAADPDYRERFRRECRLAARLASPHVIPIHDWGEIDGRLFLDMRLVTGADLATEIARSGRLPPARAVDVLVQVADALDDAHRSDLVHRDVKPSNVLLQPGAGRDFVYLVDFGVVRAVSTAAQTSLTVTGVVVGTVLYMAPELFLGRRPVDHLVDVYALGCVLHEMLVGRPPYEVTEVAALMYHHVSAPPPVPSDHGVPPAFDAVVATAMAKDPEARYASAGELAAAATRALGAVRAPVPPRPPGAGEARPQPRGAGGPAVTALNRERATVAGPSVEEVGPARRRLPLLLGVALLAVVVVVVVVLSTSRGGRPSATPSAAATPSGAPSASAVPVPAPSGTTLPNGSASVVYLSGPASGPDAFNVGSDPLDVLEDSRADAAVLSQVPAGAVFAGVCGVVGDPMAGRTSGRTSTTWLSIAGGYVPADEMEAAVDADTGARYTQVTDCEDSSRMLPL